MSYFILFFILFCPFACWSHPLSDRATQDVNSVETELLPLQEGIFENDCVTFSRSRYKKNKARKIKNIKNQKKERKRKKLRNLAKARAPPVAATTKSAETIKPYQSSAIFTTTINAITNSPFKLQANSVTIVSTETDALSQSEPYTTTTMSTKTAGPTELQATIATTTKPKVHTEIQYDLRPGYTFGQYSLLDLLNGELE